MHSILYNICKLRKSFLDSAADQNTIIQLLSGNEIGQQVFGSIQDGLGNELTISETITGGISVYQTIKDGADCNIHLYTGTNDQWASTLNDCLAGEDSVFANRLAENHVPNFIKNAAQGEKTNELLGTILDKYTTNTRSKASDICNIIQSSGLKSSDITQLSTAISSAADEDGLVSNFAILSILRNLVNSGKQALDKGKIQMDDSHIFYLTNFLASATTSIISTLVEVIGFLLAKVNYLISIIVAAIGFLIRVIGEAFNKVLPSKIVVDNPLSSVPWFDGPLAAKDLLIQSSSIVFNTPFSSDQLAVKEEGFMTTCIWTNDNKSILVNRFLSLNVDVTRFATWLFSKITSVVRRPVDSTEGDGDDLIIDVSINHALTSADLDIPESCYLTDDERLTLISMPVDDLNDYIYSGYLLWCGYSILCSMINNDFGAQDHIIANVNYAYVHSSQIYDTFKVAGSHNKPFAKHLLGLGIITKWYQDHQNYIASAADTDLTTLSIDDFSLFNNYTSLFGMTVTGDTQSFVHNSTIACTIIKAGSSAIDPVTLDTIGCYLQLSTVGSQHNLSWTTTGADLFLSSVPTDRMFKFAAYDQNEAIKAAIVIGAVTAIVLVAGTIAIKTIKKYKFKRQYDRKAAVQEAKNNYDEHQTKEAYDAFYKAQKSYNFKAGLFGWESYDAANDWFEYDSQESINNSTHNGYTLEDIINLIH